MYKHGAICGKFRLVHRAHRELIFVAAQKVEKLHIFVCAQSNSTRIMSLEKTVKVLDEIAQKTNKKYQIHILSEEEIFEAANSEQWDYLLLSKVNNLEIVFDSKEAYGNTILKNEYINLPLSSKNISVSKIENDIFSLENFNYIAPEATKRLAIGFEFTHLSISFQQIKAELTDYFGIDSDYDIFSIDSERHNDITIRGERATNILEIVSRMRNE